MRRGALATPDVRRSQSMPSIGPDTAMATRASCPETRSFENGRAFVSWLDLVPRQNFTGGRTRLGRITEISQADVMRPLVVGTMSVIGASRRTGRCDGS